jgi:cob(I)alamin adenosyltransferase
MKEKGLIIAFIGQGKGKTCAALGVGLRAVGQGMRVLMIQFIKGDFPYGEDESVARLTPDFELIRTGKGYYKIRGDELPTSEHKKAAAEGLRIAREKMAGGGYQLIILDEINLALSLGLLPLEGVLRLIEDKPKGVHLILTGRGLPGELAERVDLITEMKEIKHPYRKGVSAIRGIDF